MNLYGATKLVAEKIFIDGNAYGGHRVKFSVVRYGNVVGTRGSVVEHFLSLKKRNIKEFPITDPNMTRFWMTVEESAELVIDILDRTEGGEIFVPKISSMRIVDLARAIEPKCKFKIIGIRPGEKMHETLISENETSQTKVFKNRYIILPQSFETNTIPRKYRRFRSVSKNFVYKSNKNDEWLTVDKLQKMLTKC